jgi:hypothetical protein
MSETPPRRAGSVRRTTTHSCTRPYGLEGPVTIVARGRDLHTPPTSDGEVLDSVRLHASADFSAGIITEISCTPPAPGLSDLVGAHAFGGFRAHVLEAMPAERGSGSVRYQLLDDLPIALMLSARVLRAAGVGVTRMGVRQQLPIDICAGWIAGGTADAGTTDEGPPLDLGPAASQLTRDDDRLAWHDVETLPSHSTRRHRRIDVWQDGDSTEVDCFFRDSFAPADGVETVVHQYRVRGTVDPQTSRFVTCEAEAGRLPYPECPNALASANRIVGAEVGGLRHEVRTTLVGPTTCTHLNDTLRSLEDVTTLLGMLSNCAFSADLPRVRR